VRATARSLAGVFAAGAGGGALTRIAIKPFTATASLLAPAATLSRTTFKVMAVTAAPLQATATRAIVKSLLAISAGLSAGTGNPRAQLLAAKLAGFAATLGRNVTKGVSSSTGGGSGSTGGGGSGGPGNYVF
jgi:uncharacterized membrane protein YgcG